MYKNVRRWKQPDSGNLHQMTSTLIRTLHSFNISGRTDRVKKGFDCLFSRLDLARSSGGGAYPGRMVASSSCQLKFSVGVKLQRFPVFHFSKLVK